VETADAFEFLSHERDTVDAIFSNHFIEHLNLDQLLELMRLVKRSLRNGGIVLLRTANVASPFRAGTFWNDLTHTTPFTDQSLSQLLAMGGFEQARVYPSYPSACRLPYQLAHATYRLLVLAFGGASPRIATVSILGAARKPHNQ